MLSGLVLERKKSKDWVCSYITWSYVALFLRFFPSPKAVREACLNVQQEAAWSFVCWTFFISKPSSLQGYFFHPREDSKSCIFFTATIHPQVKEQQRKGEGRLLICNTLPKKIPIILTVIQNTVKLEKPQ